MCIRDSDNTDVITRLRINQIRVIFSTWWLCTWIIRIKRFLHFCNFKEFRVDWLCPPHLNGCSFFDWNLVNVSVRPDMIRCDTVILLLIRSSDTISINSWCPWKKEKKEKNKTEKLSKKKLMTIDKRILLLPVIFF